MENNTGKESGSSLRKVKTEMELQHADLSGDKDLGYEQTDDGEAEGKVLLDSVIDAIPENAEHLQEALPEKKKCRKKKKKELEWKGAGDRLGGLEEPVDLGKKEEWGQGEMETDEYEEQEMEEEEEETKQEMKTVVEDESSEDEYTTCSQETSEEGDLEEEIEEDELGFLLLTDPGIDEALQLREKEVRFSPDGVDAYITMCKAFGIPPIKSLAKQLLTPTIDLKFYGASAKNIRSLAAALKYNPHVKTLDLAETVLSEAAVYEIADLIRVNSTLSTIILRKCMIGPEGAKYLAEALDLSDSLENLDLSSNNLGDEGVELLAPSIGLNASIKSLNLSYNQIGQKGAKALGLALKENQTLSDLSLRWNNLYEDVAKGLKVLLSALQKETIPMQRLDLTWNALGESSAAMVRSFMVKAPLLREICIDHNRFPDAGALTIKRGLSKAAELQIFRMGFNPITSEGAQALLSAVQPQLQVFDLGGICVGKAFLATKLKKEKVSEASLEIIHGECLSIYTIPPVDMVKVMLCRARFEGFQPKKVKRQRDFGHLLLEFARDDRKVVSPDEFKEAVKKSKIKIREELVQGLIGLFSNKAKQVLVADMKDRYMGLFPETELPPPKPKKEKKKKKGKKEK